jgi:predicted ATPase
MLLDCTAKYALNTWNAVARCLQGRLLLAQGNFTGLAVLRTALDWIREARFGVHYTISLATLAEGLAAAGQFVEAQRAIDEALERTKHNEELWCMAELLRIKGEVLRLDEPVNGIQTAEDHFLQALDWARRQGALSWELRAAMSLAKLWHQDGRTAEASNLLTAVYDRFTEGFETSDLKCARALIDAFGEAPKTQV